MDPPGQDDPWADLGPIPSEEYFDADTASVRLSDFFRDIEGPAESVGDKAHSHPDQEVTSRAPPNIPASTGEGPSSQLKAKALRKQTFRPLRSLPRLFR